MTAEANSEKLPQDEFGRGRCLIYGLVCALVIGIFAWSAEPGVLELVSARAQDAYYNLLVQGFQSGQLNVKRDPAPGLATLPNPYDPSANTPYVWNIRHFAYEMSYYKGKLYLYFGVTPTVVLFWPYEILTGHYLDHKNAVVIFFAVGFLVAAGLLHILWRRYFPETRVWLAIAGLLAVGLASGIPAILSACDVYEVAKSCAFAFTMLATGAIWGALRESGRQVMWLIAASLAYGLAVGARPSLLFGAIILLVPVVRTWQGAAANSRRRTGLLLLAAVVPITLIGFGLMLYNYLRFGSPSEFGWHYQLTSFQNHGAQQFSLGYLWFNFRFYFLQPMGWTGQFPFLEALRQPPSPAGYNGIEAGYGGILADYPIAWLALAAPLAWKGRAGPEVSDLRWFAAAIFLFLVASVLTLCLFFAANSGYLSDFLPALMFLAALGIFGLERALASLPVWRWVARCGWSLLLTFSIAFNVFASLEAHAISYYLNGDFLISVGRLDEAMAQYQKALAVWPGCSGAYCGLGSVLLEKGQIEEAIVQYQKALKYNPALTEGINNLGYCYLKTGRIDEAIVQYNKVLEIRPDFPEARNNLADCYLHIGRADDAIAQYQKAVELKPESAAYQCGLGNAFLDKGEINEAIVQYEKALEIKPDFPQADDFLAYCLVRTGRINDAVVHFQKAIKLQPQYVSALQQLAWILATWPDATIRDGKKAVALSEQANQLTGGGDAEVLCTLAAAYAETGRYPEAVSTAKKALALATTQSNDALARQLQTEIETYQNNAPCRSGGN